MAKIPIFHREVEHKILLEALAVFSIFALLLAGVYVMEPAITGFATVTKHLNYTDVLSLEFNESGEYSWNIQNIGDLKSIKIDGSKNKQGNAKVYIENNGIKYLVFDSSQLVKKSGGIFGITGFAVLEIDEISAEVDGTLTQEQEDLLNLLISDINDTRNDVEIEIEAEEGEVQTDAVGVTSQQNELVNDLSSLLENAAEKIKIKVEAEFEKEEEGDDEEPEEEQNNAPIWNSDIDSFDVNSTTAINLNEHYYDADNDTLTYSSSSVENVSITINDGIIALAPDDEIDDTKPVTFAAYDGINITYKTVSLVIYTIKDIPINETNETTINETTSNETAEKIINISLEYGDDESYDADNDGIEELNGVIDFKTANTEFSWEADKDKLCTRYEVSSLDNEESTFLCYGSGNCCAFVELASSREPWNDSLYLTYGGYGSTFDNIVYAQVLHVDYNLSLENPYTDIAYSSWANLSAGFEKDLIEFENVCVDTCLVSGFNSSSYKIIVEIENTTLKIDNIDYSIEQRITNDNPALIKNIDNISLVENTNYTLDLSGYFLDNDNDTLVYSNFETANISIRFENNLAYIIPDIGFIGNRFTYITANDSYGSVASNIFKIEVNASGTPRVQLGKPVRWKETILINATNETVKLSIPKAASNITLIGSLNETARTIQDNEIKVIDKGKNKTKDIFEKGKELDKVKRKISILEEARNDEAEKVVIEDEEVRKEEIDSKISELESDETELENELAGTSLIAGAVVAEVITEEIPSNETIIEINETIDSVTIEYITEPPYAIEKGINDNLKQIKIISETGYTDVLAFTDIKESNKDAIKLYWVKDTGKEELADIDYLDTNLDGLIDRLEWVIPHLSNQTFEVSIDILNIQSYPTVGGNWTVRFNTTGVGNLTILGSNGTTYSELYNDNEATIDDLVPLALLCNDYEYYDRNNLINNFNFYIILKNNSKVDLADTIGKSLNISGIYVEDYSCNGTGYWTSQVLTEGVHTQQFNFSGQIAYANNFASVVGTTSNLSNKFVDDDSTDFEQGNLSNNTITGTPYFLKLQQKDSLSYQTLVNGAADEFEDQTGTSADNSTGETYDATSDYYTSSPGTGTYASTDEVPDMTSATAPSGEVTSSTAGRCGEGFCNWNMFDDDPDVFFGATTPTLPVWVQYQFPSAKIIGRYTLTSRTGAAEQMASAWDFSGSNDGSTWTNLDTQSGITSWTGGDKKTFTTASTGSFTYYRINVSAMQASTSLSIAEMEMLNFTPDSPNNMSLVSNIFPASSQPDSATIDIWEEDIDAVTLNTDLKAYVSRDAGTTWSQATLAANRNENVTTGRLLRGTADLSSQPSGTSMKWNLTVNNSKELRIHGVGLTWGENGINMSVALDFATATTYYKSGNFTSRAFDANKTVNWTYISWQNLTPVKTNLTLYTRTSADNATWSAWRQHGTSPSPINSNNRYIQYKAVLNTSDTSVTPLLLNATLNYSVISNLSIWDDTDTLVRVVTQPIAFYANFTDFVNTINGSGINCSITFNDTGTFIAPVNMSFDPSNGLYSYNHSSANPGTFIANVTCDATVLGYNLVQVLEQYTVYPSLNITVNLNVTLTTASQPIAVSGHINLSNGTNVSNNVIRVFLNESELLNPHNVTDDSDTDFNKGVLNTTKVFGSGGSANISLLESHAVVFDGANDFLTRGADLTGNADGKLGTVSVWVKFNNVNGVYQRIYDSQGTISNIQMDTDNTIRFYFGSGTIQAFSATKYNNNSGWIHILASWNLNVPVFNLYINDVDDEAAGSTETNANIDYTRIEHTIGAADEGTPKLDGSLSQLYMNFAEYLNISNESNRRKFIDENGNPVDLGWNGSLPTGTAPIIFLNGTSDSFITNKGSGGGFIDNGTLTNSTDKYFAKNGTGRKGNFTSQAFDSGNLVNWTYISWEQEAPYQKEIGRATGDNNDATLEDPYINTSGLVLLMHFNNESVFSENTTLAYDFSADANSGKTEINNGTIYNGAYSNITDRKFGNASINLDGSDDQVNISNEGYYDTLSNFTVSAWVLTHKTGAQVIATKSSVNNGNGWELRLSGTNGFFSGMFTSSGNQVTNTPASPVLSTNRWYHVAAVYDETSKTIKNYLDGADYGTTGSEEGTFTGITENDAQISIGRRPDGSYWDGLIDELAIWNRSLSADEILKLYKRGALELNISTRTSDDNVTYSEWSPVYSNETLSYISQNTTARYLQYKAIFSTQDASYTPILNNITINYTGLFTDSFGNYNFTFNAPAATGAYAIKVNSTWDSTIPGENSQTLTVVSVPVIQNIYTIPTYPRKDENVTFYVNVSDEDSNILSVNFTVLHPNGSLVYNYTNGSNNGNDQNWNVTFNVSQYGTYRWNVSVYDGSGFVVNSTAQTIILMELTAALNDTAVLSATQDAVYVSGHINLSNGTNVSNNLVNVYQNGGLLSTNITEFYHNKTDDSDSDFNRSTDKNATSVRGTGGAANVTLADWDYDPDGNLSANLTAYWKLDETSSNRTDYKGSNNLRDINTVTSNPGVRENAAQFTASNSEFLNTSDNADLSTGDIDFTIAAWVYADSFSASGRSIASKGDENSQQEWNLRLDGADKPTFAISSTGGTETASVAWADALTAGRWYFIVAWHDSAGNTINLDVNNNGAVSAASGTGPSDRAGAFVIGKTDGFAVWDGRIDEVGFWKRILTQKERSILYNGTNVSSYPYVSGNTFKPYKGNFTSQALDAGGVGNWTYISWSQEAPYGKEIGRANLDNNNAPKDSGHINTSKLILLMHFNNETGENNSRFKDYSVEVNTEMAGNKPNNGTCDPAKNTCPVYNSSIRKLGDYSVTFNGKNGVRINISNSTNISGSTVNTVALWFYPRDYAANALVGQNLFSSRVTSGAGVPGGGLGIQIDWMNSNSQGTSCWIGTSGWANANYAAANTELNEWHHLVCVYDGSRITMYIDGTNVSSAAQSGGLATGFYTTWMASNAIDESPFNGSIDEVAMWNRSLSTNEVLKLYKRGVLRLNISTRTSNDNAIWSEWTPYDNETSPITRNQSARYLQYLAKFNTTDGKYTPVLHNITINYTGLFTDSYGNYNFTFNAPAATGAYAIKVNATWADTIPGENTVNLEVVTLPTNIIINASPLIQGFGQNVTLTANVTDNAAQVDNVLVEVKANGITTLNFSMALQADELWKYNFTDFTNGTYAFRVYTNSSGLFTNSSNKTFDMFVNLTIQVRTVNDNYGSNEFVNLTDPPGLEEDLGYNSQNNNIGLAIDNQNNNYQLKDNVAADKIIQKTAEASIAEKIKPVKNSYYSLLLILLVSVLLNVSIIGINIANKGSINLPLLILINLLLLVPIVYAFSGSGNDYTVGIANTPYVSVHDANASGYNISFQLNEEAYGRDNASRINATLGQIYISAGVPVQPTSTGFDGSTTDFSGQPNLQSVCNAVFENTSAGKIEYISCLNAEGMDISSNIFIRKNYAEVKARNLHSTFNRSANITLTGLDNLGYPKILKDNAECTDCSVLSWDSDTGVVKFNVSSFSIYNATEANQSKIQNNGTTNATVYLLIKVQFYNKTSSVWVDNTVMVNDSSPRTLYSNGTLVKFDSLFNGRWNTSANASYGGGTYRVFAAATDENDIVLQNLDGDNISAVFNFTINFGNPRINFTAPTPTNNSRAIGNVHVINVSVVGGGSTAIDTCTLEINNGTIEVNNGSYAAQNLTMELIGSNCNVTINTLDGYNYTLKAYVNDTTGNQNSTENLTFRENTMPEIPTLLKPLNNSRISANSVVLNYTAQDNDTDSIIYNVYFDTNANPADLVYRGTSKTFVVDTGSTGTYFWKAQADDTYENSSNSTVFQFTKNTAPPTPFVITPNLTGIKLRGGQTYNISWDNSTSDADGDTVKINLLYSTDSGVTFPNGIASGRTNNGTYDWLVPSIDTDKARVQAVANDSVEFSSDASDNDFIIDSTPPVITLDNPVNGSGFTNGTFINLTITDLLSGVSNVSWNNGSFNAPNRTDFNGTFDINTSGWAVGEVNITVYANDSAGNLISAYYRFNITDVRPVVQYNVPAANQKIGGTIRVNVTGTSDLDDAPFVNFTYDGAAQNFTMTQAGTDYYYDFDTTTVSDGLLKLSVYGNDTSGRVVREDRYSTIDNTGPAIRLDSPLNDTWKNSSVKFLFTPNDASGITTCSLVINGTTNRSTVSILNGLSNNFSNIEFGEGIFTWTINCTDEVSNTGTNASGRAVKIDTIRPVITLIDPPNGSSIRANKTINFTVTDTGAGVGNVTWSNNYLLDVTSLIDAYAINTSEFPEGKTNVSIRANDSAGNIERMLLEFIIDFTPPIAEFNRPGANEIVRGIFRVNITATDALSNVSGLTFAFNGSSNFTMNRTSPEITSDYFFDWNTTNTTDKQYIMKIYGNDTANNVKFENRFAIVDNTAPAIKINSPANNSYSNTASNSFQFIPYELNELGSCTLFINGTVNATTTSLDRNMTNTITATLGDGVYRWTVSCNDTAVDTFGIHNTGSNDTNFTITVDTAFPTVNATINNTSPKINEVINISANITDETGLSSANITINFSTGRVYMNYTLSGTSQTISNATRITDSRGHVLNITVYATDTSNNVKQNSTLITVADTLGFIRIGLNSSTIRANDIVNVSGNITEEDADVSFGMAANNQTGAMVNTTFAGSGTRFNFSNAVTVTLKRNNVINFTVFYNDTSGTTIQNSTLLTVADTAPTFELANNNTNAKMDEVVQLSAMVNDSDTLSMVIASWNGTNGVWINISNTTSLSAGINYSVNRSVGLIRGDVIGWLFYANDSVVNAFTASSTNTFVVADTATIFTLANNNTNAKMDEVVQLSALVQDNDAVSMVIASWNGTNGAWRNISNSTSLSTNINYSVNASVGLVRGNVIGWLFYSNDSAVSTFNASAINTFVVGDTAPTFELANNNTNAKINEVVQLSSMTNDSDALSMVIASWNGSSTGAWINVSNTTSSSTGINYTVNFSVGLARGQVVGWLFYSNDSVVNIFNSSIINTFTVANTAPNASNIANETIITTGTNLTLNFSSASDADSDTIYYLIFYNSSSDAILLTNLTAQRSFTTNLTANANYSIFINTTDYFSAPIMGSLFNFEFNATITTPPISEEPSGGGDTGGGGGGGGGGAAGGGGGGAIISQEEDFSVSPGSIKTKLVLGESSEQTLTITNTGDADLTVLLSVDGVRDYLFLSDSSLSLDAGQSADVTINFIGKKVGSFTGRILARADGIEKEIPVIIESISEKVLFDAKLDIPTAYAVVSPGGTLKSQITLLNVGAPEKVDVVVTYLIKDLRGNVVYQETETFAVEKQASLAKSFKIPESLEEGSYVAIMEVRYADSFAVSSQLFEVKEKKSITEQIVAKNTALTMAMALVLIVFVIVMLSRLIPKKKANDKRRK